jgi:hypothetical protein
MPVTIHRDEPGIYRGQWQQHVHIEDVINSMNTIKSFADEDDVQQYVALVDLRGATRLPFDVGNLRRVALSDERCRAFVVVKASYTAQVLGQMLNQLTDIDFLFADDIDEAFETARSVLATESSSSG